LSLQPRCGPRSIGRRRCGRTVRETAFKGWPRRHFRLRSPQASRTPGSRLEGNGRRRPRCSSTSPDLVAHLPTTTRRRTVTQWVRPFHSHPKVT
jgi:hypothetical protein